MKRGPLIIESASWELKRDLASAVICELGSEWDAEGRNGWGHITANDDLVALAPTLSGVWSGK